MGGQGGTTNYRRHVGYVAGMVTPRTLNRRGARGDCVRLLT